MEKPEQPEKKRNHGRKPDQRQTSMAIPMDLYDAVKRMATMKHRSFTNMVVVMLEEELVRMKRLARSVESVAKKSEPSAGDASPPKPDPLHALPIHTEARARSKVTRAENRVRQEA